ncbi:hypothetical protein E4T49_07291 [Aureobasidium sp. EXF-10728]|nr:hypothetical protein E4T49_07291 [Aureobasidium sp. EXF-10728]
MPDNESTSKSTSKSTSALVSATLREHTAPLTERTETIVSASQSIDAQKRTLVQDTQKLSRQAEELEKTIGQSVDQLKELGDLQNWAEVVFRDISVIEETLRMVEEQEAGNEHSVETTDTRTTQSKDRPQSLIEERSSRTCRGEGIR